MEDWKDKKTWEELLRLFSGDFSRLISGNLVFVAPGTG